MNEFEFKKYFQIVKEQTQESAGNSAGAKERTCFLTPMHRHL